MLDILPETVTFYTLQSLDSRLRGPQFFSRGMLKETVTELAEYHTPLLARAIYDYLALAATGEARHGSVGGEKGIFIDGEFVGHSNLREDVFPMAMRANPVQFLPVLHEYFSKYDFPSGYGGAAWANVVSLTMEYGQITDIEFIDRAVDLSHNNGTVFDKGVIFKLGPWYRDFLNEKRNLVLESWSHARYAPQAIIKLIQRAYNLGVVKSAPLIWGANDTIINNGYEPVQWGDRVMEIDDVPEIYDEDDEEEDDDQEEAYEPPVVSCDYPVR